MGCSGSKSGDVQEPKPVGEGAEGAPQKQEQVEQNGTTPAAGEMSKKPGGF